MKPSSAAVLRLLQERPDGISQLDALAEAHCLRLAARVTDLRAEGYPIEAELVTVGSRRFARYRLVTQPVQLEAFG